MKKTTILLLLATFIMMAKAQNDLSATWQEVHKLLKPDEAAIEFVAYRNADQQLTDSVMYAAMVILRDREAAVRIPLCDEKLLISLLQHDDYNKQRKIDNLYLDKADALYQLVWQKLERELADIKTIYYSPAGLLHRIAFNALPAGKDNRLLLDKYNLHLVSGAHEIARLKKETTSALLQDTVVIYGGLTYESQSFIRNKQSSPDSDRFIERFRQRNTELPDVELFDVQFQSGFGTWQYLPGAKSETEEIVKLLESRHIPCKYYSEEQGTEESFKQLDGTNAAIIHVATHSYFLPDIENPLFADLLRRLGGDKDNLMLGSGLIMSGANEQWTANEIVIEDGKEDGILTSDEISRLDLKKTKLAVLSGSETGLGYINGNEGVVGLQRAFKLAGVESLIMSLWDVPDIATVYLMQSFYELWLSGQSRQSAFRSAQQKVREKYQLPYFWAAFVMMD